jgi:antitoxin component YwqK of YwqJK toxin-antitoxin module
MTRTGFLLSLFLLFGQLWGQNCQFDTYKKKGSLYYFSTYYSDYSKTLMQGECTMLDQNGRIYEKRIFKDGIIQSEELHHYMNAKPRITYKRKDRDSIIGIVEEFDESARLHERKTYYWNKDKRRCWLNQIFHPNGNKILESSYIMFRVDEIVAAGNPVPPDHIIDSEGFADDIMPFGWEYEYYPNGKLMCKKRHRTIVAETEASYDGKSTLEGPYELWNEQGNLLIKGQYLEGREHGIWNQYHLNGKLSGVKQFDNGTPIGTWRSYHENGITSYEAFHDVDVYNCFTPHELFYNANGQLLQEKWIKSNGQGFNRKWNEMGVMIFEETYMNGPNPQYPEARKEWYADGHLKYFTQLNGRKDTAYISYYPNGVLQKININGIHYQMQREQFENGKLKMLSEATTLLDYVRYHFENYYSNGNLQSQSDRTKDTTVEQYYFHNGIKKLMTRKVNFNLDGLYQSYDSTGKVLVQCNYQNGLRLGDCLGESKRKSRPLSNLEERKLQELIKYSIARSGRNFLGHDSLMWMIKEASRGLTYLPDEWKGELLGFDDKASAPFLYQIIRRIEQNDSTEKVFQFFVDSLGLKWTRDLEKTDVWQNGFLECEDFYSSHQLSMLFNKRFPKMTIQLNLYPSNLYQQNDIDFGYKGNRRQHYSYIHVVPTKRPGTSILKCHLRGVERNFVLYPDDLEIQNRFFDWNLPEVPFQNELYWD